MCSDLAWDDEVDVVCTDVGVPGLAVAIAAADLGGDVMVASQPPPESSKGARTWFEALGGDAATAAYFAELAADVDVKRVILNDTVLSVRSVHDPGAGPQRRTVPPFDGGRLRNWTAECIASPTGYVFTSVTGWPSTTVQTPDGDSVEVLELPVGDRRPGASVHQWLTDETTGRDVLVRPVDRFEGLVFEEGAVIGAVFATPQGGLAVRARHGVLACRAFAEPRTDPLDAALQIALVGRAASRFGRVELLTTR